MKCKPDNYRVNPTDETWRVTQMLVALVGQKGKMMKYWDFEDWLITILCIVLVIALVWLIGIVGVSATTDKLCAEHGWPSPSVQWNYDRYCEREINETEYICPLEDVLADSCVLDFNNGN